ncbi:unnamed protein product [Mytilus coruscus]|uniref:C2H2-type domain-containing protein n=1 Tax=Mytilus coruscus TaxID=42192 RepID=A0A6J8AN91_MYTCO|nr:unnamed protein product [Mytilus coruscus]
MHLCLYCNFSSRYLSKLVLHYRFVHEQNNDFQITCGEDGCCRTYKQTGSYIKHVKRKHPEFHHKHFSKWKNNIRDHRALDSLADYGQHEENTPVVNDVTDTGDIEVENNAIAIDFKRRFALFLLQLREKSKLPSNAIVTVVKEISEMIGYHHAEVSKDIIQIVNATSENEEFKNDIRESLNCQSTVESACNSLNSEYNLNKFVIENFGFVKPVEYNLASHRTSSKQGKYQYIPILETIQQLLKHDDVFSFVINGHCSTDGILRDFCDGEFYSKNELFSADSKSLEIMLYYDVNPIGNKVKNFKIGAFYMMLGNIPPKHRSQLYSIQLVTLCMSSVIKTEGFKSILQPLIQDLKKLETEGIDIVKEDDVHKFYGSISVVVADNLAAHALGGFQESFNCLRNCRFCFVTKNDMHQIKECNGFRMRSVEMHNSQLQNVQQDESLSSVYGVKSNSVLNELEYYHIISGMPSDLAHDLFEGVVCDVLTNVIKYCVTEDFFSLETINNQIQKFNFCRTDKKAISL